MSFKSVNEIDKFSFTDCQISDFTADERGILMELEALIVMPNNSQNTNYTKSYAGTTSVSLENGRIDSVIKEGWKVYDVNDKLVEDHPDEAVELSELKELTKKFKGAFLYQMAPDNDGYNINIEITADDDPQGFESDIYRLHITFDNAIFRWDRYMSRVQE